MGATNQRQFTYINQSIFKVFAQDGEPPERANAFASALGVGHIAFGLACWTDMKPVSSIRRIHETFGDAIIPIWPVRGPIQWPPRKAFSPKGLDRFAGAFGGSK